MDPQLLDSSLFVCLFRRFVGVADVAGSANGWPALQVQILQELIGTARRLANVPLAIRHAALLVHLLLIQQRQVPISLLSLSLSLSLFLFSFFRFLFSFYYVRFHVYASAVIFLLASLES